MPDTCNGSLGEPGKRPGVMTFLPTARCPVCERFVEIHPMEPSESADAWRLEMHDTEGHTIRVGEHHNPAPDCLMPRTCANCGSRHLTLRPDGEDVEADCAECGQRWHTGHLNAA